MKRIIVLCILAIGYSCFFITSCEDNENQSPLFKGRTSYLIYNQDTITFKINEHLYAIFLTDARIDLKDLDAIIQREGIKSYQLIREDICLVESENPIDTKKYGYVSFVYINNTGDSIIICPTIIVKMNDVSKIQNIQDKYEGRLSLQRGNSNNTYLFECDVDNSEDIFAMVNEISREDGVEWCEPDMLGGFHSL